MAKSPYNPLMKNLLIFLIRKAHRFRMAIIKRTISPDVLALRIWSISKYIQVRKVIGFDLTRIGGSGDGGYVMLDNFQNIEGVLSLGVGPDVSWDLDMNRRTPLIHLYDHSILKLPKNIPNGTWFKEKIVSKSHSTGTAFEIAVQRLPNSSNLILKCDIEDSEWEIFAQCSTKTLSKFDQILIEFHWLTEKFFNEKYELMVAALENLSRTHSVVNIHGNNYADYEMIGNCPVPSVIEISYARTKSYKFEEKPNSKNLNAPNDQKRPEISLSFPIVL
jgi:hypothetical protein